MVGAREPRGGGAQKGPIHGGWLVGGWLAACVAAGWMLLSLSSLRPSSYPAAVEFAAVFGYVTLTAIAGIMTVATLSRFWTSGE